MHADSCFFQKGEPPDNVQVPSGLHQPGLSKNLTVQEWECQDHVYGGGRGTTAFVYEHTFKPFQNTTQVLYLENLLSKHGHSSIRGGGGSSQKLCLQTLHNLIIRQIAVVEHR